MLASQRTESKNSAVRQVRGSPTTVNSTGYHGWDNPTDPPNLKNTLASGQTVFGAADAEQPTLPRSDIARQVNAEVTAVNADGVLFNCLLPEREVTIQLPKALISTELQKLGQPVTISFAKLNGIRVPSIQAREVEPVKDAFDVEMRSWLNKR